jgi:hypothetical protein
MEKNQAANIQATDKNWPALKNNGYEGKSY